MKLHCPRAVYWGRNDCKVGLFQVEVALVLSVIWIEPTPCGTETIFFFLVFWSLNDFRLVTSVMPPASSLMESIVVFKWHKFFCSVFSNLVDSSKTDFILCCGAKYIKNPNLVSPRALSCFIVFTRSLAHYYALPACVNYRFLSLLQWTVDIKLLADVYLQIQE